MSKKTSAKKLIKNAEELTQNSADSKSIHKKVSTKKFVKDIEEIPQVGEDDNHDHTIKNIEEIPQAGEDDNCIYKKTSTELDKSIMPKNEVIEFGLDNDKESKFKVTKYIKDKPTKSKKPTPKNEILDSDLHPPKRDLNGGLISIEIIKERVKIIHNKIIEEKLAAERLEAERVKRPYVRKIAIVKPPSVVEDDETKKRNKRINCFGDQINTFTCGTPSKYGFIDDIPAFCLPHVNIIIDHIPGVKIVNYDKPQCNFGDYKICPTCATHGPKLPKSELALMSPKEKKFRCSQHLADVVGYINLDFDSHFCQVDYEECYEHATYGNEYDKSDKVIGIVCQWHKDTIDNPVCNKRCICKDPLCSTKKTTASYGIPFTGKALYCSDHADRDKHIDVKVKMCEKCMDDYEMNIIKINKITRATYGDKITRIKKHCGGHRDPGEVDVSSKMCAKCGNHQPCFNYDGEYPLYCKKCKKDDMINVSCKKCGEVNVLTGRKCIRQVNYGYKFCTPIKCFEHKKFGMERLYERKCEYIYGCGSIPTFGLAGQRYTHCAKHKDEIPGLISKNKKCISPGCDYYALRGFPGCGRTYCETHAKHIPKLEKKRQPCSYEKCTETATHGYTSKTCCELHKKDDMKNLIHTECNIKNCNARATWGIPGNKSIQCPTHAKDDPRMVFRPRILCETKGCGRIAIYGPNDEVIRCEICKDDDDINLIEKPCETCLFDAILNENNMCESCTKNLVEPIRLRKQNNLMNYLDFHGMVGNSTDVVPSESCNMERPDRVYYFGHNVIILECDEEQHKRYTNECEIVRMFNIAQDNGGQKVYFIRFNPDKYNNGDATLPERYKLLLQILEGIRDETYKLPQDYFCSALYLYYDGWNINNINDWKVITQIEHSRFVEDKPSNIIPDNEII